MHARRKGFTLVELLVVVGIIGVLMGILVPALGMARRSAREVRSLSGLRQMMFAYTLYYQANDSAVLFGYPPPTVNGVPMTVTDPASGKSFVSPVADRYPWRLLPYVDNIWQIIHSHDDLPPLPLSTDSASDAFLKAYTLSLSPTYGINAVFVGGQNGSLYQGFVGRSSDTPNFNQHVVFKAQEVRDPTRLIVFADCQVANVPSLQGSGMHYLTPPHANGHNWQAVGGKILPINPYLIMGLPKGWYSSRVMTAFFDGHCQAMEPSELDDMRLWANRADTTDYDFVPAN